MLTVEEREEIEAKLADYPNTQAVAIEALLIIQRHQGWVSDEKLRSLRLSAAFRCQPGRCSDVLQLDPPEAGWTARRTYLRQRFMLDYGL